MPHFATNRPRFYITCCNDGEAFNAFCYLVGGCLFVPGSVLFLPHFFETLPRAGAALYVTGRQLARSTSNT
eukprot:scaffold497786_cov36-Prasinocladus_malaysianus.AAC.1